ncbi:MAG: hypothetical protein WCY89_01205 [Flavobacteriaceae bacterium]
MIDGVKIKCIGTTSDNWLNNPLLKFASKVDTVTGEFLAKNKVAFYRGLSFHIVPSTVSETDNLFIRGSLATFYNKGKNNAFDYDVTMLAETIQELETVFNVNPNTAVIQAFEFGANINPQQSTKTIIKGLRAYQNHTFGALKVDNVFNGLQLKRQDTNFKIYDKGIQTAQPQTNTLRIEYALHFSKVAKKHGFEVLADFLNVDKLHDIKRLLLEVWANAIFYDKGMKWRSMNQKDKEKMLYYLDCTNWDTFTKMQRKRAKDNFRRLYNEFCTSTTQTDVLNLLAQKLNKLTAEKGYHLQNFLGAKNNDLTAVKMLPFTTLDKLVKGIQNDTKKPIQNTLQKKSEKLIKKGAKNCCVCGSDISHKKPIAVYCSKYCNNSKQAQNRKMKRQAQKKSETEQLAKLLANLHKSKLKLLVEYRHERVMYADHLHQSEITTAPDWVRKVTRVTIRAKPNIVLTSHRAKKLIRTINKLNLSNYENKSRKQTKTN